MMTTLLSCPRLEASGDSWMESMGRRQRSFAFLIVVGGILTFFLPLVTTDPPVMGRTRWSEWNIACQAQAGNLPPVRYLFRTERVLIVYAAHGGCNLPSPRGRSVCSLLLLLSRSA